MFGMLMDRRKRREEDLMRQEPKGGMQRAGGRNQKPRAMRQEARDRRKEAAGKS